MMDELARIGFVDVGDDEDGAGGYNTEASNTIFINNIAGYRDASDGGNSLLHIAALLGRDEIISRVLQGFMVDVNRPNSHQHRALHFAASLGHVKCIKLLLDDWATIDVADSQGQTPLFKAAEGGHFESVRLLALRGANVNVIVKVIVDEKEQMMTPIIAAARSKHSECVTELLRFGANVSYVQKMSMLEKKFIQEVAERLIEYTKASCSPVRLKSIKAWTL